MDQAEQYFATLCFDKSIYEYSGQAFEDFFISIMTESNINFKPVKAYGRIGDKKNDGFDETTGTYYQVFSPEDILKKSTITEAVTKLENDFEGLYKNWDSLCPIKQFYFVINDKYKGVPAPINQKVLELKSNPIYAEIKIDIFMAKDLKRVFQELTPCSKQNIIGFIPIMENLETIEYSALNEVVKYLNKLKITIALTDTLVVPDFNDKIVFNHLSEQIKHMLINGSYQEGALNKYFNENPGTKELLQKKFHALYTQSINEIEESTDNFADMRFVYILEKACFDNTIPVQTCVLILMAYYFSSCDIFEEPEMTK